MLKVDKISAAFRKAALKCPVILHCRCFCTHDMHLNPHIGKRLIQLLRRAGICDQMVQPVGWADIIHGRHAELAVIRNADHAVRLLHKDPQQRGFIHPVIRQTPLGRNAADTDDQLIGVEHVQVLHRRNAGGGKIISPQVSAQTEHADARTTCQLHCHRQRIGSQAM